jgi:hypothetical protein
LAQLKFCRVHQSLLSRKNKKLIYYWLIAKDIAGDAKDYDTHAIKNRKNGKVTENTEGSRFYCMQRMWFTQKQGRA